MNNPRFKHKHPIPILALKHIFARPILAALIVGSLIHLGKWINYSVHELNYFLTITHFFDNGLLFAFFNIFMPFMIPFIVISTSRRLANLKELEFVNNFPDFNPDLIIKCRSDGSPFFINTAVKALLFELDIPVENIKFLLPIQIFELKNTNVKKPIRCYHSVQHVKIEYLINHENNDEIFLSGRINLQ